MGLIVRNSDKDMLDLRVVKTDSIIEKANLPFPVEFQGVEEDSPTYTFEVNGNDYFLCSVDGTIVVQPANVAQAEYVAWPVYVPGDEDSTSESLRERLLDVIEHTEKWLTMLDQIPALAQHPEVFQMSLDPSSIIIDFEDFRYDLHFHGGPNIYARVMDWKTLEGEVDPDTLETSLPLALSDPLLLHPIMGVTYIHYLAHELSLGDPEAFTDQLASFLDPHYGEELEAVHGEEEAAAA